MVDFINRNRALAKKGELTLKSEDLINTYGRKNGS